MMQEMQITDQVTITLVRAGATQLDAQGRISGVLDSPMCEEAAASIRRTAAQLSFLPIDTIYPAVGSSADETAKLLAADRRVKIRPAAELQNLDCGLWQGKRIEEVKRTQPRLFRRWAEAPETTCPPNGETIAEVQARVQQFLKRLRKRHRGGQVVVVAPEPLYSIVRREIDEASIEQLLPTVSGSGEWETLSLMPVAT
jgi:broad specificity phosphatase PhoE